MITFIYQLLLQLLYAVYRAAAFVRRQWRRQVYLRFLRVRYHHNQTPGVIAQDAARLRKLPSHVACVVRRKPESEEGGGVAGLLDEVSELAAWCLGAGIHRLSVYERTGVLKRLAQKKHSNGNGSKATDDDNDDDGEGESKLQKALLKKLGVYYGTDALPSVKIRVPPFTDQDYLLPTTTSALHSSSQPAEEPHPVITRRRRAQRPDLLLTLLAQPDGKATLVDLARVLADLRVAPATVTIPTITAQLRQLGQAEPDLVVLFSSTVDLDGFPPWLVRLAEIFHLPENGGQVSYAVFLKALEHYAGAKFNVGK
jgi:dehydrodolichyl diphosphate syntase complex subunit NUS1